MPSLSIAAPAEQPWIANVLCEKCPDLIKWLFCLGKTPTFEGTLPGNQELDNLDDIPADNAGSQIYDLGNQSEGQGTQSQDGIL